MINSIKEIRIFENRTKFYDNKSSHSVYWIESELEKEYKLNNIKIEDNDIIIDIGAHVGVVSTYLSKINPKSKIYAYEPTYNSYHCLTKNLKMNGIENVTVFNKAVTSDGRNVKMMMPFNNTGGSSLMFEPNTKNYFYNVINSLAINELISGILEKEKKDKIKLLKIDCEGAEYEILKTLSPELFSKIEYLVGEFHTIKDDEINTPKSLLEYCQKYIKSENINVVFL